jgi:putative transposase
MARPLRIQLPGLFYHVVARGNAKMPIFLDNTDRLRFLSELLDVTLDFYVQCHAFCLMSNHFHLVLRTLEANLSEAMRELNGNYASWWNRRHGRCGSVFQGRFHSPIVQDGRYFMNVSRYVVRNPLRAGLVDAVEQYPWSSYRATVGLSPSLPFLTTGHLLGSAEPAERRAAIRAYREFVGCGDEGDLRRIRHAPVIGDQEYVARFAEHAEHASDEVPMDARPIVRPPLGDIIEADVDRQTRDAAIWTAHGAGYSVTAIARFVGLHYAYVSRIVRRMRERDGTRPRLKPGDILPGL